MTYRADINATELISVTVSPDGCCLRLRLRDQSGRISTLALPVNWLNTILNALPRRPPNTEIHPLDSWNMDRTPNGQDLVLTLRTPDGQAVSFAMKPWQIEGMATIATYGNASAAPRQTLH
jgi:hypothetical protein